VDVYVFYLCAAYTVAYATKNDRTTNECYNDQFLSKNQDATTNDCFMKFIRASQFTFSLGKIFLCC
jgi:hypothetical protein